MSPETLFYHSSANAASYQLDEHMLSYSTEANQSRIRISDPGESEHDSLLLAKLGEKGWGRIQYFKQVFSAPWGNGEGRPLSPRSLASFFDFLSAVQIPEGKTPSIFLTNSGHLELCWEDSGNKAVQLEFGPQETDIYIERNEQEFSIPNGELKEFAANFQVA